MKKLKLIALTAMLALAGTLTACVSKDNTPAPPAPTKTEAPKSEPKKEEPKKEEPAAAAPAGGEDLVAKGKAIYTGAGACIGCHGPEGKGVLPNAPNFTDAAWHKKESDETLSTSIKKGKGAGMPAYKGGQGTDDEIKALVAYVRSFGGVKPADAPKADAGKTEAPKK